ncbi:MAG: tetratricopeptide repeat protein [Alphaproteobacteria bacterium]|nr:tetratricopeptide repeat protein [Alphaproteobacteria bacterium]
MKKKSKDTLAEDALINEVSEEVKNDQMKQLWNKYGLFVIIFVALALTVAVSFETFKSWINKKNEEISNAYAVAVSLQIQGRTEESLKIFETISQKSNLYSDIAKLQMANIYLEQEKNDKAIEILEFLSQGKGDNEQMQEIAILKLAGLKLEAGSPAEEIKHLLSPLIQSDGRNYTVAHELLAMLAIRDKNFNEAKQEYEYILASANSSDTLKSRAQDMITILEDQE